MWLSLMKAITLRSGSRSTILYEVVTHDELVVVAESDDPGPRGRSRRACARPRERVREQDGHHVLVDCGLRLGLALDRYTRHT